jgi:hypothetical protein
MQGASNPAGVYPFMPGHAHHRVYRQSRVGKTSMAAATALRAAELGHRTLVAAWKDAQAAQLQRIREGFEPLPVKTVPLFGHEVLGLDGLRRMAAAAFGTDDPVDRFSERYTPTIEMTSRTAIGLAFRFLSPRAARSASAIRARSCSFKLVRFDTARSCRGHSRASTLVAPDWTSRATFSQSASRTSPRLDKAREWTGGRDPVVHRTDRQPDADRSSGSDAQ